MARASGIRREPFEHTLDEISSLLAALQEEKDLLEVIMENTQTHLAYLDAEFDFIKVNSAYVKGSGHLREELIGNNHFDLFRMKKTGLFSPG